MLYRLSLALPFFVETPMPSPALREFEPLLFLINYLVDDDSSFRS